MDDEEISCQIPRFPIAGSSVNLFYCDTVVRLAQLSSRAFKGALSYQAFRKGPKALANAVQTLAAELEALRRSKEQEGFLLDAPIDPSHLPAMLSLQQALYLQYAYFNTELIIHAVLTTPWSQEMPGLRHEPSAVSQSAVSVEVVAQTCRKAILATQHIQLEASTPVP